MGHTEGQRDMKWLAAFLIVFLCGCATPVPVETGKWSAPGDVFTVTVPKAWTWFLPKPGSNDLTFFGLGGDDGYDLGCGVMSRNLPSTQNVTQAYANTYFYNLDERQVSKKAFGLMRNVGISNFANKLVDGVRTISFDVDGRMHGKPVLGKSVQFVIAAPDADASMNVVFCFAPTSARNADFENIAEFMSSMKYKAR